MFAMLRLSDINITDVDSADTQVTDTDSSDTIGSRELSEEEEETIFEYHVIYGVDEDGAIVPDVKSGILSTEDRYFSFEGLTPATVYEVYAVATSPYGSPLFSYSTPVTKLIIQTESEQEEGSVDQTAGSTLLQVGTVLAFLLF